jgi:hypothetical protein
MRLPLRVRYGENYPIDGLGGPKSHGSSDPKEKRVPRACLEREEFRSGSASRSLDILALHRDLKLCSVAPSTAASKCFPLTDPSGWRPGPTRTSGVRSCLLPSGASFEHGTPPQTSVSQRPLPHHFAR